MSLLNNLSVIVPVAPDEKAWKQLCLDLRDLPQESEIIFAGPTRPQEKLNHRIKWIDSEQGRAKQLNAGAQAATKKFLWFVHADSRFETDTMQALEDALKKQPQALHYFHLAFLSDGPPWMFINEIGCRIRSQRMGLPFGDQGFCLSRENFECMGAFPENVDYGEDHVFIWRAHQKKIPLRCTQAYLKTSARKYAKEGWLKTTLLYYKLWTRQAKAEKQKRNKIHQGQSSALAVFVKTPGLTPLKTRLAKTIGNAEALNFYKLCLRALKETLRNAEKETKHPIFPYWAVAEGQGLQEKQWIHFSRVSQGSGSLGNRLHRIYSKLQAIHQNVILIGADAPQITSTLLLKTHHLLQTKNKDKHKKHFIVGPAQDGGFYLFAASMPLPASFWESISYSQASTCDKLKKAIEAHGGKIVLLPPLSDVDHKEDLILLSKELKRLAPSAIRKELLDWIGKVVPRQISFSLIAITENN